MCNCIQAIISSTVRCEREYTMMNERVLQRRDVKRPSGLKATQMKPEYTSANKCGTYTYKEDFNAGTVIVVGAHGEYKVDLRDWSCDCNFASSMRLPCRHSIAYRKFKGKPAIPLACFDPRYRI